MNTKALRGEIVTHFGTQNVFAEHIGWHKNKVSKMIQHKYKPNSDEICRIANVLNLSESKFAEIFLN